jgi:cyclopropane-fatty-acyl-phospholipid synthase
MTKYIYQGLTSRVYFPKFVEAVTKSPFEIVSVVNDRRNYHLTIQHWFQRFEKNQSQIRQRFGERVYRMYRLYLAGVSCMLDHPSHLTTAYRVLLELPTDAELIRA